jgi:hypothetical protein
MLGLGSVLDVSGSSVLDHLVQPSTSRPDALRDDWRSAEMSLTWTPPVSLEAHELQQPHHY